MASEKSTKGSSSHLSTGKAGAAFAIDDPENSEMPKMELADMSQQD